MQKKAIHNINNSFYDHSIQNQFNSFEKIIELYEGKIELYESKIVLYERMLRDRDGMIEELKKLNK